MSIIIGLTGPTGAGKSLASKTAEKLGLKVIDCDITARQAVEKGSDGLNALVKAFGNRILLTDGSLNRKELAKRAFKDKKSTEKLNSVILPFIVDLIKEQTAGEDILLDAPTLIESGLNRNCVSTVAVLADKDIRLSRIIERDNISKESALLRINAGKNDDFYKQNADYIIYNNGDDKEFVNEFCEIIKEIIGGE